MVKGTWKRTSTPLDETLESREETNLLIDEQFDFFPLPEFTQHKKLPIDKTKIIVLNSQSGVPTRDPSGPVPINGRVRCVGGGNKSIRLLLKYVYREGSY